LLNFHHQELKVYDLADNDLEEVKEREPEPEDRVVTVLKLTEMLGPIGAGINLSEELIRKNREHQQLDKEL
jgi:hypothetical protein